MKRAVISLHASTYLILIDFFEDNITSGSRRMQVCGRVFVLSELYTPGLEGSYPKLRTIIANCLRKKYPQELFSILS